MICFYFKIPETVMYFFLQDRFWFVYVTFVKMMKSKFITILQRAFQSNICWALSDRKFLQDSSQYSCLSQFFYLLSILPHPFPSLLETFQVHQIQLISLSLSFSTAFFSSLTRFKYSFLFSLWRLPELRNLQDSKSFLNQHFVWSSDRLYVKVPVNIIHLTL